MNEQKGLEMIAMEDKPMGSMQGLQRRWQK